MHPVPREYGSSTIFMFNPASFDDDIAREKGRLLAAQAIAHNPEQKRRVEEMFGKEYVKQRLPEAYRSGFGRLLDKIFPFTLKRIDH